MDNKIKEYYQAIMNTDFYDENLQIESYILVEKLIQKQIERDDAIRKIHPSVQRINLDIRNLNYELEMLIKITAKKRKR